MKPHLPRTVVLAVLAAALVCVSSTARADPPPNEPPHPSNRGWVILALSVAAGTAVTAVSMSIECDRDDLECARWASLGIWGGIGIASAGTVAGILVVKADSRAARVRLSFNVDRSQGAPMPRATLVYTF